MNITAGTLRLLSSCSLALLATACAPPIYDPYLVLRPQRVEQLDAAGRPSPAEGVLRVNSIEAHVQGLYGITQVKQYAWEYRDTCITISMGGEYLEVLVTNNRPSDILVHWAGIRFTDPFGHEGAMIHGNAGFESPDHPDIRPQPPSRMAADPQHEHHLRESLYEESTAEFIPKYGSWGGRRLMYFSVPGSTNLAAARSGAASVIGKDVSVLFPIEADQHLHRYLFTFRIVDTVMRATGMWGI